MPDRFIVTFEQVAILALLALMFVAYALERFRIEVVALSGLAVAYILGMVPLTQVFTGFSSAAVMTVVEILLVVSVLSRTRAIETFAALIARRARGERAILAIVCLAGGGVSVFMNNIGALALMFPVTLSLCARLEVPPARMLMPLSFATLLGGMCSLTGTPANLVINDWRIAQTGSGFGYFSLGSVGGPVALVGIAWLVLVAPRQFRHRKVEVGGDDASGDNIAVELSVPPQSSFVGMALDELSGVYAVHVHGVVRGQVHVFARRDAIVIQDGDRLLVEGKLDALDALQADGLAEFPGGRGERLEAVVTPESYLVGSRIADLQGVFENDVAVIGIASRRRRFEGGFDDLQIGLGDVLLLAGERQTMREAAREAGLLALAPRVALGARPDAFRSVGAFALGVAATAFGLAPPEISFGAVVLVMALTGTLKLREALQDVNWTIVILLACMIPLGAAVQDTGAARVIADAIVGQLPEAQPFVVILAMLLLAALITPFADNVSVAAVLSPVAVGVASRAGIQVSPLLVAVAIGASFDFLTPFGHHNNAVVMGAAGYRFTDFPRLGLPLVGVSLITAAGALWLVWL